MVQKVIFAVLFALVLGAAWVYDQNSKGSTSTDGGNGQTAQPATAPSTAAGDAAFKDLSVQ